jgi:hypothetical protein
VLLLLLLIIFLIIIFLLILIGFGFEKAGVTHLSEVPCRVSSDLHEWRNDWTTVSTSDSVKL